MCIAVRRQVIKAVKAHMEDGTLPANVDNVALDSVRPVTAVLPEGADWVKATAPYRSGASGAPVAWEMKPMSYILPTESIEAVGGGGAS